MFKTRAAVFYQVLKFECEVQEFLNLRIEDFYELHVTLNNHRI